MTLSSRLNSELQALEAGQVIRLRNVVCPYCGCALDNKITTKEHVVGRRFVPKGKLHKSWNLILNACRACNNKKADLENDISAISLFVRSSATTPQFDSGVISESVRKSRNSISRKTKKPVQDSFEKAEFKFDLNSQTSLNFNFIAPPQVDENRAFELARLQLAGFFYWITYQETQQRGYWWTGEFLPMMMVRSPDYGNKIMVDFSLTVLSWEPRVLAHTDEGFFSVCIRRHPQAECWSWALEWNYTMRLIGFLGDRETAQKIADTFGPLKMENQNLGNGDYVRFRQEVALDQKDDKLFEKIE